MSREVKFRGLVIEPLASGEKWITTGGEYCEIYINHVEKAAYINGHAVKYDSVSQSSGLFDKNGVEIYEGNIFQWDDDVVGVIKYQDGSFYLETNIELPGDSAHAPGFYSPWLMVIKHELENELEIIGNIHDNPELLEVAE